MLGSLSPKANFVFLTPPPPRFTPTVMTLTSCGQDLTSSLTCYATFKTSRRSTTFPGSRATLVGSLPVQCVRFGSAELPDGSRCRTSSARLWRTFCSFPGLTNWRAKTASTKTSSECSRLTDWRTSTSFHRPLCFPTSIRNSAVRPSPPIWSRLTVRWNVAWTSSSRNQVVLPKTGARGSSNQ